MALGETQNGLVVNNNNNNNNNGNGSTTAGNPAAIADTTTITTTTTVGVSDVNHGGIKSQQIINKYSMDNQQQQQFLEDEKQVDVNSPRAHSKGGNAAKSGKMTDAKISFLRAARSGELQRVIEFLESGQVTDINACNVNGLNALHLAAKDGYVEIVNELLRRGAKVDNTTKKGNSALHIASLAGQKEVIKLLIQYGANVNIQSLNGFTPLYMAAQENHDSCVRYLLAKGANPSLATEDGFTPLAVAMQQGHDKVVSVLLESDSRGKVRLPALHIAAKKDDVKAATLLLENEHNPDIVSKSGFTPLHIAAHYGNVDIANLLIDKGADVNYTAKHNITPLHVACKWGKTNMLHLLLSRGVKIDSTTRDGLTPLHCAARSGHEKVIEVLLRNDAPILSKTKNGLTPLHMTAQGEHDEAARILLLHKAPIDEVTVDYLTALHVAAHCGHVKVAKLLLDNSADPNARALNGFTPLHIACKKNRIKVVELLLKHNANISATTESGLTPLHVASFMGCMNIVIYLLQHDANPDAPTVRGETALHLAARANQTDIIRILLRNGAQVDVRAREGQTPLHVASRLGNIDIVMLLLQHGANVVSPAKDLYTPLHIAAKEGQEEVANILIENNANLDATTKKGFTPLHLAAKYGNLNVAKLLIQKGAKINVQGKNGVTPLHVAAHYDNQNVALLLLENGSIPHIIAKNGHTPLHISAKKNQMNIATNLLQYGSKPNAESKSGFTPLHLACQEGHIDMVKLLLENQANPNQLAKNGLTPMHLCAQEDKNDVAKLLLNYGAKIDHRTKTGYTPLHVAAHYGQVNMVKFLLENDAHIELKTNIGYTPLHQAAQQGHTLIINLLLTNKANPNALTNNGQTALSIANKLGYVTAVETLKVVTETSITNTVTGILEEKYKVVTPESMHETFMSDSEDEGGTEEHIDHHQYKYMAFEDLKTTGDVTKYDTTDDCAAMDVGNRSAPALDAPIEELILAAQANIDLSNSPYAIKSVDIVNIVRQPIHAGFLVSFLVDARGGAMRGCRHSGVRVIVPPKSAAQPTRITCRYVKPQRLQNPPPLMEGEALVSRVLELSPVKAKFLGPVILEIPHFGSLRNREREIIILRSDNGETWREHTLYNTEEAVRDVLNETFDLNKLNQLEDLHTSRIILIVTHDFPHFFAVVSRIRQEVHAIGPDGGTVSSTAVPKVQAIFPQNALTKKIRVGLQAQPVDLTGCAKLLGQGVAVSPVVTVEPRRRKFHKAITLSIPAPRTQQQGMINQYSGNAPTLRLLCSITGGQNRAIWEDVTGSTPLTFVKDSVSFTTTVSARFWLMDCRNISDACRMATELYTYMAKVPFMVKFVVFGKRISKTEAKLSVFCMTDDKEDKTLEHQEYFTEIAKSRDVEVLEDQYIYLEFIGNLIPILKSGEQLYMQFLPFRENRLSFIVKVRDQDEPFGYINFMCDPKTGKNDIPQQPICALNASLASEKIIEEDHHSLNASQQSLDHSNHRFILTGGLSRSEQIHKADIRLSDICNLLGNDWEQLANELKISNDDIQLIKIEYRDKPSQQAMIMLKLWLRSAGQQANGNILEQALHKIKRSDIVDKCIFNMELVTDEMERAVAKIQLDQSGFDNLREELEPSPISKSRKNISLEQRTETEITNSPMMAIQGEDYIEDQEVISSVVHSGELNNAARTPPTVQPEIMELTQKEDLIKKKDDYHHHQQQQHHYHQENWNLKEEEIITAARLSNEFTKISSSSSTLPEEDNETTRIQSVAYSGTGFVLNSNNNNHPKMMKTIKKHSKTNIITKISQIRPTVDEIEWNLPEDKMKIDQEIIKTTRTSIILIPDESDKSEDQEEQKLLKEPQSLSPTSCSKLLKKQTDSNNTMLDDNLTIKSVVINVNNNNNNSISSEEKVEENLNDDDDDGNDEDEVNDNALYYENNNCNNSKNNNNNNNHNNDHDHEEDYVNCDINFINMRREFYDNFYINNGNTKIPRNESPNYEINNFKLVNITNNYDDGGSSIIDNNGDTTTATTSTTTGATTTTNSTDNINKGQLGSSSDSDIALHEPGTELSEDDETEADFYQGTEYDGDVSVSSQQTGEQQQQHITKAITETTTDDDDDGRQIKTITTTTTVTTRNSTEKEIPIESINMRIEEDVKMFTPNILQCEETSEPEKESLQNVLTKFMTEERKNT